jgi:hypothetical protein
MSEIARLRKGIYTEQVNVRIDADLKARIKRLKEEKLIDTGEEARKALAALVERLERATG